MSKVMHSIPILGLSWGGGALSVEHALGKVDGVLRVYVNSAKATAYVSLDSDRTPVEDVVHAVEKCGYETGVPHLTALSGLAEQRTNWSAT